MRPGSGAFGFQMPPAEDGLGVLIVVFGLGVLDLGRSVAASAEVTFLPAVLRCFACVVGGSDVGRLPLWSGGGGGGG